MRTLNRYAAGQIVLLSSALWFAAAANAGLKEKPPKGLDLSGSHWQLDPYRSDDPEAVLDKAREDMSSSRGGGRRHGGGMNRGVFGGGGGEGGGGGFPGGGRRGGGGGGWGQGRDSGSSDEDSSSSSGGSQPTGNSSRSHGSRGQMFSELSKNPDKLGFESADRNLKVIADSENGTECAAGAKVAISDSQGDGERNCGWDGRAWVIETKRGKSFTRTDRYELAKDGKTLTYVTTAAGDRGPKIKISRTYTVATTPAPGAPPPPPPTGATS